MSRSSARKVQIDHDHDAAVRVSAQDAVAAASPSVTYAEISRHIAEMPQGATRKLLGSTLVSWMRALGKEEGDDARHLGPERLDEAMASYEGDSVVAALSYGTRSNRRSGVRSLSSIYCGLLPAAPAPPVATVNPYWEIVNPAIAVAKLKPSRRKDLLKSSAHGRMPQNEKSLRRTAAELKIDPNLLLPHVWFWRPTRLFDLENPEYRWNELHHELTQLSYLLEELPPRVEEQVGPFLSWRRASSPQDLKVELLDGSIHVLRRTGGWTRRPNQEPGEYAPTERIQREFLRGFFGFANLSKDHEDPRMRGLGIPLDDLRLAHLYVGANVTAYCNFQKVRNGSFDHTGLKKLRQDWCLLIGSKNSYGRHAQAANREDLAAVIGRDALPTTPDRWNEWCSEQLTTIDGWIGIETEGRLGKNKYKQARCAEDNLDVLFARRRPMEEVVWPTVYWLAENRPPAYYTVYDKYLHESKIFTLASMAAEPLRVENWQEMLWGRNLFKREGKWVLNVGVAYMKNRRVLIRPYKSTIEDTAQEFIESWYQIWKKMFGYDPLEKANAAKTSYVHAAQSGNPAKKPTHEIVRCRLVFLKNAWGITVGPQAFRHIWATDWLKRHPEDYGTVAGKLNDTVETVIKMYGHLKSEDHSARANEANAGVPERAREHLKAQIDRRKRL